MNWRCNVFNHKAAGRLPSRCVRCDAPMGGLPAPRADNSASVSPSEAVLLAALGEITALGATDRGRTHHAECKHAPCIAARAIEDYWRIVLAPFRNGSS